MAALREELRGLAERTHAALSQSHDYFTYTKRVWRLLQDDVNGGRPIDFRNPLTKSRMNQQGFVRRTELYIANYLTTATFQHFVLLFEDYFFDLLRLWLTAHPGILLKRQVDLGTVLKLGDANAVVLSVVDRELNEVKYDRIAEWFAYLDRLVKLGCPTPEQIERLAEIKAARDILVHNRGVVNATYLAKAGRQARYQDGERLEVPEPYHRSAWELIGNVVRDLSEAAILKA